jgi:hypothetical protein
MAIPLFLQASRRSLPVTIKTRRVPLDERLERVICSNVRSGLGRFCHRVRHVFVWIEDTNGPRHGSGMRCRMDVALLSGGRLSLSAEASNEYTAVARCTSRARALLDRRLKRQRRLRRRPRLIHGHI